MTWDEVISAQHEAARRLEALPISAGDDEAARICNEATDLLFLSDVSGEAWHAAYDIHDRVAKRWFARWRAAERDRRVEQLRADHVTLAARATRCA